MVSQNSVDTPSLQWPHCLCTRNTVRYICSLSSEARVDLQAFFTPTSLTTCMRRHQKPKYNPGREDELGLHFIVMQYTLFISGVSVPGGDRWEVGNWRITCHCLLSFFSAIFHFCSSGHVARHVPVDISWFESAIQMHLVPIHDSWQRDVINHCRQPCFHDE